MCIRTRAGGGAERCCADGRGPGAEPQAPMHLEKDDSMVVTNTGSDARLPRSKSQPCFSSCVMF